MLNLSTATRIFVALEPVDLRQSFNGLHALVQRVLQQDPLSGHLFVFTNRIRTFGWPTGEGASRCLRPEELNLLIHGLEGTPRRHWYRV
jgi:transposase